MINKQELMSKLEDMNEEAHQSAMATWLKADMLEEAGLDLPAEDKRDEASEEQTEYFDDLFEELSVEEQEAVWHYVETDPDGFGEQFYQWYRPLQVLSDRND
jgi:hypothetical protein